MPTEVRFDPATYSTDLGMTNGDDYVYAFRIRRTVTGVVNILLDTFANTHANLDPNQGPNRLSNRVETDQGSVFTINSGGNPVAVGDAISCFLRCTSGDSELFIDGVSVDTDAFTWPNDLKLPKYINNIDGAGSDTTEFNLIGGLWIGNDATGLSYSDFFDGSNNPIFNSDTINGVVAQFFQNGDAADWNALDEIVGNVTNVFTVETFNDSFAGSANDEISATGAHSAADTTDLSGNGWVAGHTDPMKLRTDGVAHGSVAAFTHSSSLFDMNGESDGEITQNSNNTSNGVWTFTYYRWVDENNFWRVGVKGGGSAPAELYERDEGTFTLRGTTGNNALNGANKVVVHFDGDFHQVTLNDDDANKITHTSSLFENETLAGIGANNNATTTDILDVLLMTASDAVVDPSFANVNILCPFDANLSDLSDKNLSWTASGNAAVTVAQSKWGGKSLHLDGAGDYLSASYVPGDHDWFAEDFTVECFARVTAFTDSAGIPLVIGNQQPTGGSGRWAFGFRSDGRLRFMYRNTVPTNVFINGTNVKSVDTWYHIALTLSGTTIRGFVDGVEELSATVSGTPFSTTSHGLTIGAHNSSFYDGYIDDLRLTKGVARYTANFTPPAADFPRFGPSGGVSGDLAATEAADTATLAGDLIVQGDLASTEAADTATLAGDLIVQGDLAATEAADTASVSGGVTVQGDLAATEAADTAALTGDIAVLGDLVATEASDTAALAGAVSVLGDLAATEASDVALFNGTGSVAGDLAATDAADAAAISAGVVVQGDLAVTELPDVAAFNGSQAVQGNLAASEAQDTAVIAGGVAVQGDLVATEAPDVAALAGGLVVQGDLASTEAPDIAALAGVILVQGNLVVTEAPDVALFEAAEPFVAPERNVIDVRAINPVIAVRAINPITQIRV